MVVMFCCGGDTRVQVALFELWRRADSSPFSSVKMFGRSLMKVYFVNGAPSCGNKGLLTDVLRKQWNFRGFVVSDYDAYTLLWKRLYTKTLVDAAAVGLNAGLDQEGGGNCAKCPLRANVSCGNFTYSHDQKTMKLIKLSLFVPVFRPKRAGNLADARGHR